MGKKKHRRVLPWVGNFWVLNQKWTKIFFLTHLIGLGSSFLQTSLIIREVRKLGKNRRL